MIDPRDLTTLVVAVFAIFLLGLELYFRRRLQKRELILREKLFEKEKQESEARQVWLNEETVKLTNVSSTISSNIVQQLETDIKWASDALKKAKLISYSQSLFGDRLEHFQLEKELLSREFVPILLDRCKHIISVNKKKVYLVVDSGTTLYSFLKELGTVAVREAENKNSWIKDLTIVSNNLPGIQVLMEEGRLNPRNRYSKLSVNCFLLPGEPVPVYSALLGPDTEKALIALQKEKREDALFISLVTGNWVNVKTNPAFPIPLARGYGHKDFKQTIIQTSDEIYVLSPLGKIFLGESLNDINLALGCTAKSETSQLNDPSKEQYVELDVDNDRAKRISLITTARTKNRMLYEHFIKTKAMLNGDLFENRHDIDTSKMISNLFIPFDRFHKETYFQMEQEFPHRISRTNEFMTKHFDVHNGSYN